MRETMPNSFALAKMSPREDPANPVPSRDFVELVWENGSLLTRGRSNQIDNVTASAYARSPNNDRVGFEEGNKNSKEKAPGFGNPHHMFMFNDDNSRLYQSSLTSFFRPGFNNMSPADGFSKPSSRSPDETKKVNFSHFLGLNSPISRNGITHTEIETDKLNKKPYREDKDPTNNPVRVAAPTKAEVVKAAPSSLRVGMGSDSLVPDEHSQAMGNNFIEDHFMQNNTFDDDYQVPTTDSSIEASNAPRFKLKRRRFDGSESTYLDEDEDGKNEDHKRTVRHYAEGSTGTKRSRSTIHNLSEKKRRDRINKRLRTLQELLPNCNKVDKASVLDEAIEYMKTLQLQLQMMSTGNRMFAPTMAMLPSTHQMMMPYLNQFSPVGAGMGMRMGPGFNQGLTHQFPLQGPGPTGLAGGFQPMGCMPYIPVLGGHPALGSLMNAADFSRAASTIIDQLSSVPVSGSNDSIKTKDSSEVGHGLERDRS